MNVSGGPAGNRMPSLLVTYGLLEVSKRIEEIEMRMTTYYLNMRGKACILGGLGFGG